MKILIIGLFQIGALAYGQYSPEIIPNSIVAPVVSGTSAVNDKVVGMVIFDASANQFKGLDSGGNWKDMTAPSGNTVISSTTAGDRIERAVITTFQRAPSLLKVAPG